MPHAQLQWPYLQKDSHYTKDKVQSCTMFINTEPPPEGKGVTHSCGELTAATECTASSTPLLALVRTNASVAAGDKRYVATDDEGGSCGRSVVLHARVVQ